MHHSPEFWHQFETLTNHFVELIAPFLLFMPRSFCMVGGAFQILFQVGVRSAWDWYLCVVSCCCNYKFHLNLFWFPSERKICKWRGREVRLICIFSWNGHLPLLRSAVFCCLNYKFHCKEKSFSPKRKISKWTEREIKFVYSAGMATRHFSIWQSSAALTTNSIVKKIVSTQKENIQAKKKRKVKLVCTFCWNGHLPLLYFCCCKYSKRTHPSKETRK